MDELAIDIRPVERFDEPEFTDLLAQVFDDRERAQAMQELLGDEAAVRAKVAVDRVRIGAFAGEQLVGWSVGWLQPGGVLYVGNSAVLPPWRRRGIYAQLMAAIEQRAIELGCQQVASSHRAANAPVLIAKLRAGYVICGTEFSLEMGLLVKMVKHLGPERERAFDARIGSVAQATALRSSPRHGDRPDR